LIEPISSCGCKELYGIYGKGLIIKVLHRRKDRWIKK